MSKAQEPASDDSSRPRRRVAVGLLLVLIAVGLAVVAWKAFRGSMSDARRAELFEQANVAIGLLENGQHGEAAEAFGEIADEAPEELMPRQNLAVARVLNVGDIRQRMVRAREQAATGAEEPADATADEADLPAAISAARESTDALIEFAPQSAAARWLAAQTWLPDQESSLDAAAIERAVAHLEAAAERSPADPAMRYSMYDATQYLSDEQLKSRGIQALGQAYKLAPQNLTLLRHWLVVQAERQDAGIVDTIAAARETIAPLRKRVPFDIEQLLTEAAEAAVAGNWPVAMAKARGFSNVISNDDFTRSDLKRVHPHPLEFAMQQFSEEFRAGLPPTHWNASAAIDVVMKPADNAAWQAPPMGDVTDLRLVDVNLDKQADWVLLGGGRLMIYVRAADSSAWEPFAETDVPAGLNRFVLADLFMVDAPQRPMLPAPAVANTPAAEAAAVEASTRHDTFMSAVLFGSSGVRIVQLDLTKEPGERLTDITAASGLALLTDVAAVLPVDIEHDGDLDLVTSSAEGIRIWANRGNATFEETTAFSVLPPADARVTSLIAVDWDRDVDIDIVASGPEELAVGVLENMRHGQFRWRPASDDFPDWPAADSIALLDADGNASWDIVAAGATGLTLIQTAAPRIGTVRPLSETRVSNEAARHVMAADLDNDGFQDLVSHDGRSIRVFRGRGSDGFAPWENVLAEQPADVRAIDVADADGDGDLDLAIATASGPMMYENDGGNANHWLALRVRGIDDATVSGRVNHYGIGSLIEVRNGTRYKPFVVTSPVTHIGLGSVAKPDVVRLVLTNGIPQALIQPDADQVINEKMMLKGSCPFVYTWTGERFEFFTDLLWAAPLGLQSADGVLVPGRPWEYLLVPGDRLRPKDGEYVLQVTEELWEAAYFDQIELIAVDHPTDVEIFSNEKVGPPAIAEYKLHTVRERRLPVAARDQCGRDVLAKVLDRDGDYAVLFDQQFRQGLVKPTFIELDLGDLDKPQQITLFLTGWIQPTDTSLNIAIDHDPRLEAPRHPSISVPDADGNWHEVIPYMGFPGGKPKTIAVDLSGAFLTDDYRLRIATTAQIYWDEAFFTVDETPAETRQQPLELLAADLHYRGFSARPPRGPNDPELFDYSEVTTEPQWPPMQGRFTRYGEVAELLRAVDDRLLVMSAGDEVTLRFKLPAEPPPAGWKRDFILHNWGWDKDADLNTVFGQTAEPYPFAAMRDESELLKENPHPIDDDRHYFHAYQTREQRMREFWMRLTPGVD